jgi:hypothetical protein
MEAAADHAEGWPWSMSTQMCRWDTSLSFPSLPNLDSFEIICGLFWNFTCDPNTERFLFIVCVLILIFVE